MIEFTPDEFEQLIAFRERIGREATSEKPSKGELFDLYQRMEILLREVQERQSQESSNG